MFSSEKPILGVPGGLLERANRRMERLTHCRAGCPLWGRGTAGDGLITGVYYSPLAPLKGWGFVGSPNPGWRFALPLAIPFRPVGGFGRVDRVPRWVGGATRPASNSATPRPGVAALQCWKVPPKNRPQASAPAEPDRSPSAPEPAHCRARLSAPVSALG